MRDVAELSNVEPGGLAATRVPQRADPSTRPYLTIPLAALLLAAFAIWNGAPLLYEDTAAYVGRIAKVVGIGPAWLTDGWAGLRGQPAGAGSGGPAESWLAGRSVYWGAAAYVGALAGGTWGIVALNALGVATVLSLLWFRGLAQTSVTAFLIVVGGLVLLTGAGAFVALLTPDSLTAVLVLALALLGMAWSRLRALDRALLIALASFAAVSHDTLLALAGAMGAVALLAGWRAVTVRDRGFFAVALATPVVAGIVGSVLFSAVAVANTGRPPLRLPFLTARLASTPAGLATLHKACPSSDLTICRYRDRLPVDWTDFLFDRQAGVYAAAPPHHRHALADEQYRFAAAVFAHAPLRTLGTIAGDVSKQLVTTDLADLRQREKARYFDAHFPVPVMAQARGSRVWQDAAILDRMHGRDTAAALVAAALLLAAAGLRRRIGLPREAVGIIMLILAGVLLNALICGSLASPWGRFQARVLWVVPAVAGSLAAAMFVSWLRKKGHGDERVGPEYLGVDARSGGGAGPRAGGGAVARTDEGDLARLSRTRAF